MSSENERRAREWVNNTIKLISISMRSVHRRKKARDTAHILLRQLEKLGKNTIFLVDVGITAALFLAITSLLYG